MFTVKLIRGNVTKLVAATTIVIYPAGKPEEANESPAPPVVMTNKMREISVETSSGQKQAFYIGDDASREAAGIPVQELWDHAFIENANGATTERVYAY